MKKILQTRLYNAISLSLIAINCCILPSCSSSEGQLSSAEEPITFPAEFNEDGTNWTKSTTISESDLKLLTGYFKKNSSMAEGPLISGDPTLYTSSKGAKRFYWGRSGVEEPEWIALQFDGRKATVEEGTGSPLSQPSS